MERKQLFQYWVLLHKTEMVDGEEVYKDSELVIEPTYLLARNEKEVMFTVIKKIPDDKVDNPNNIDIGIRNFQPPR